ncbi:chemotaxis protein CheB [uncultured Methylobacterium sp.]|uniref:chemotaxis protein CheB n=1 Tax=uncultured Methylobacterium sp. TaxID=157278 RepID=UPI0035CAA606
MAGRTVSGDRMRIIAGPEECILYFNGGIRQPLQPLAFGTEHCPTVTVEGHMGPIIIIAVSAGGLSPLRRIIAALPATCAASVLIVSHVGPNPSILPAILGMGGNLPVSHGEDGEPVEAGHVYVAPPDRHTYLDRGRIHLDHGAKVHHTRPAAGPLFISAAEVYGDHVLGIVLGGYGADGAEGSAIKEHGGVAIVQAPDEAEQPAMPWAAILADYPDACLPVEKIAAGVALFCAGDRP